MNKKKKNALFMLLFLSVAATSFGVVVENDGVIVEHDICYKDSNLYGCPYCLKISNQSSFAVVVDPSMVTAPIHSFKEMVWAIRTDFALKSFILGIISLATGFLSYSMFKSVRDAKKDPDILYNPTTLEGIDLSKKIVMSSDPQVSKLNLFSATTSGIGALIMLYNLFSTTHAGLRKKLLHEPFTIQPGEAVEKIFWLKNPKDEFTINFDTIKVLK